jgi:hypothetical protein
VKTAKMARSDRRFLKWAGRCEESILALEFAIAERWLDDLERDVTGMVVKGLQSQADELLKQARYLEGGGLPNLPAADTAALISEAERITIRAVMEADGKA